MSTQNWYEMFVFMYGNTRALRSAAASGAEEVVKLLSMHPSVDPSAYDNFALRAACANGNISAVELLVSDPRVDASMRQNQALRLACTCGYLPIVLLLAGPQALTPSGTGAALTAACDQGHSDIVLADGRVQVSAPDAERAMRAALAHGTFILERLRADARVVAHPQVLGRVLDGAAFLGNGAAVERLLGLPEMPAPAAHHTPALESAAEAGHLVIVQRLLADRRMSLPQHRNSAAAAAAKQGHTAIVDSLLTDPLRPVDPQEASLMTTAAVAGHLPLVKRLAADPRVTRSDINLAIILAVRHGHACWPRARRG